MREGLVFHMVKLINNWRGNWNRKGEGNFDELVDRLGWIAFIVIILGAMYFLIRRFVF